MCMRQESSANKKKNERLEEAVIQAGLLYGSLSGWVMSKAQDQAQR